MITVNAKYLNIFTHRHKGDDMPEIKMKLKPFRVPNYVLVDMPPRPQEGMKETPTFPLAELDEETLTKLCKQFVLDVFEKAGKHKPKIIYMD